MKVLFNKLKDIRSKIFWTLLFAVLLSVVFMIIVRYIYIDAEKDGYESLHIQTKEIKEDIELQMVSDCENLYTMAQFAANQYSNGKSFEPILNSFESIGLIQNIGILMPDNTFVTKNGEIDVNGLISFDDEVKRGSYISGRVRDLTNSENEVVRSAVPIVCDGEIVAVLYGLIEFNTLENRYMSNMAVNNAQLFVLERGNGNLLINTIQGKFGNISSLSTREYLKGFSYEQLYNDIKNGKSGYSSFVSAYSGENLYIHYSPLNIGDWYIMLAMPEAYVFAEAQTTWNTLTKIFISFILVVIAYVLLMLSSERKQANINYTASVIRRLLLGINQEVKYADEALREITEFSKSKSAFFLDTDGEYFNYTVPAYRDKDIKDVLFKIIDCDLYTKENDYGVYVVNLSLNEALKNNNLELYELLKAHNMKKICFAVVLKSSKISSNGVKSILGVVDYKKNVNISVFLKEISVCFSMAVFNKKHLERTEYIAVTDALTGLLNRVAYKKDVAFFDEKKSLNLSCIYIDVNELHIINNKYGHSAGDGMLIFVANTLKEVFDECYIYRIGGDEFLVFVENVEREEVQRSINILLDKISAMNYHISIGMSFRAKNINTEDLVLEAEKRMYEDKAVYYQRKKQNSISYNKETNIDHINTGIYELDETLSIMSRHYRGIYCVTLDKDRGRRILMPEYFSKFSESDNKFSEIFSHYVHDMVKPDYQRALLNFLEFDVLRRQVADGHIPCISYTNTSDEDIMLSVYPIRGRENETLWIFERK